MERRVPIVAAVGAAAALAVGLATPWEGADARGGGHHHGGDKSGKLLFFACTGAVFLAGAKILDALRLERERREALDPVTVPAE